MQLTFNNEIVGGLNEAGKIDFNLYEVAKVLGYAQPRTAVQNFMRSSKVFSAIAETLRVDCEKADESVLFAFLLYSNAPRAIEFQTYVCTKVLPLVRQLGGTKELEKAVIYRALINHEASSLEQLYSRFDKDTVDLVLSESDRFYSQLGYLPPSKYGNYRKVHEAITLLGVFDSEGNPLPEYADQVYFCSAFQGPYNGKWYAFKQELVSAAMEKLNKKNALALKEFMLDLV